MARVTVAHKDVEVTLTLSGEEARYLVDLLGPETDMSWAIYEPLSDALDAEDEEENEVTDDCPW